MHRRHRLDANHQQVRQAAEACGWFWWDCSQTHLGVDAILIKCGRLVPIEVKDGSKPISAQALTPHEADVHTKLRAHGVYVHLVRCVEDLACIERPHFGRAQG